MRLEVTYKLRSHNFYLRRHWSHRWRAINELADLFYVAREEAGLSVARDKRRLRLTLVFPKRRKRDVDNYVSKVLMDALQKSGVIMDDSPEGVKVVEVIFKIVPGKQRILVDVFDI